MRPLTILDTHMNTRFYLYGFALVGTLGLMGMASAPPLRDIRFSVSSVTLTGPTTISNGSSANYTLTAVIVRDGIAQNSVIRGTQGPPPPRIRPSIMAGNTQLARVEIDIPPNTNTITVPLTLSCVNNEVRGPLAGTGAGGKILWWDNPAEIRGHLNERDSSPRLRILCGAN
jgi:hypothetical protein